MAVKERGGGDCKGLVPPKEKGEEDFPGHIQENNATREHGQRPVSA